jgi:hypothetical protein
MQPTFVGFPTWNRRPMALRKGRAAVSEFWPRVAARNRPNRKNLVDGRLAGATVLMKPAVAAIFDPCRPFGAFSLGEGDDQSGPGPRLVH